MKKISIGHILLSFFKIHCQDIPHKDWAYKRKIYEILRGAGGVYIKFLQVLAVSHKFMDGWSTIKDYEVFNQVDEEFIDVKKYLLHQEQYKSIDTIPFAKGSFAQVYKATLLNDKKVVLKVLRPSVYNNLDKDLKKLHVLVKIFKYFLPDSIVDYEDAFIEFARNTKMETDYENEIANIKYFANYYKNHPSVIVPKVYDYLCSSTIIVEEYMDGVALADLITNKDIDFSLAEQSNLWKQIVIVGGEALRTAMVSDYVYGDPHLGNILLLNDGKVALVDFGLVAKKPISQEAFYLWVKAYYDILLGKNTFEGLLKTTCMCFCPDITNALNKYFGTPDLISSLASILNQDAKEALQNNDKAAYITQNGHLLSLFLDYVNSTKALRLKLDMQNYQLLKAMQAFIGSVTILTHQKFEEAYVSIMLASMKYALDEVENKGVVHDYSLKTSYSKNESYELLIGFLTNIANSDESLFDKIMERMCL